MITEATPAAFLLLLLLQAVAEPAGECSLPPPDHGAQLVQNRYVTARRSKAFCEQFDQSRCGTNPLCGWNQGLSRCQAYIAWFHPMKCGSTFGATLAHFANGSLPEAAHMPSCGYIQESDEATYGAPLMKEDSCPGGNQGPFEFFVYKYPSENWFSNTFWLHPGKKDVDPGNHRPIPDDEFEQWKGRFVGLFRKPESRVASSFNHFVEGKGSVRKYARFVQGLVTKLLAGRLMFTPIKCEFEYAESYQDYETNCSSQKCLDCISDPAADLQKAFSRLQGFAFLGLTEYFDLSVCLFHAMFGGDCHAVEFLNMRKGVDHKDPEELMEKLKEQEDPYDGAVYAEVSRIFWANVKQYNVSAETCARICPAGSF